MDIIPLFPLQTVLLPRGRIALRIFEPRYLDLVSRCLKQEYNGGFGVVWLREGSEVYQEGESQENRLAQIGSYSRIVDWDALPNGMLGITIEGTQKFRLLSSYQQPNHLTMAEIEWIDAEPFIPLPEGNDELRGLLTQLLQHRHIERLKLNPEVDDISSLGFLLAQLLPFPEAVKFQLLAETDPLLRLQAIMNLLDEISG